MLGIVSHPHPTSSLKGGSFASLPSLYTTPSQIWPQRCQDIATSGGYRPLLLPKEEGGRLFETQGQIWDHSETVLD